MTTSTFPQMLAAAEQKKRDAERRVSDADRATKSIVRQAEADGRTRLNADEDAEVDRLVREKRSASDDVKHADGELQALRKLIDDEAETDRLLARKDPAYTIARRAEADDGPRWVRSNDQRPAAVGRSERFADHEVVANHAAARATADQSVVGQHGSLGHLVRAMTTTSGSAVVPTVWAGDIIDRARNLSAVLRAGAEIIPMDAKTVQIGRLTADPTAAFRTEGSTITASDPTFDNVTLDSKTMSALVVGSLEWFQDSPNVDQVVSEAIAAALANQLDLMALMGGVTTGGEVGATGYNTTFPTPPNPRGVLATLLAVASSSVLGSGANGTAQTAATYWREVQQTVFQPQTFNEQPNAILWNAKLLQQYVDVYDTTNQPLQMPANIAELQRFTTNQIESFTQGTMTNVATDLFVGDWTQLLIGQRLDFTIQTLTERYAENGQIGIVAHWRGDVQLARPRAFAVYRYLAGAA